MAQRVLDEGAAAGAVVEAGEEAGRAAILERGCVAVRERDRRHLAAGAVGERERAAGGWGQAGHAVVEVVGEGPAAQRAAGKRRSVVPAVVAVAQRVLGLQAGRTGGGRRQPVDDVVGEGQVRVIVVRRCQIVERVIDVVHGAVGLGHLGQTAQRVIGIGEYLAPGIDQAGQIVGRGEERWSATGNETSS